ncbi:cupin domain-containing protein, partial [Arthrospira platensis SPKY1]|nr:cupin domain-containing protein [Arthrospira platensis SPKY1]
MNAKQVIKHLNLRPLPIEGGFYRETFQSEEWLPESGMPRRYTGAKRYYSAIYFLITPESWSTLHRLPTDEIFHFYLGDPVEQLLLYPDGNGEKVLLGNQLELGAQPQVRVPGFTWQGARLAEGGAFALLGTTMSPG